jgi:hypothetical protein
VTVRLGTPISAFGQDSRNRAARQRIPHRAYTDSDGVEHHHVRIWIQGWGNPAIHDPLPACTACAPRVHGNGPDLAQSRPLSSCVRYLTIVLCAALQQIQFHAKGPSNSAVVQCSMYQDSGKQWQYDLLFLDFAGPVQQRIFLEGQQHQ